MRKTLLAAAIAVTVSAGSLAAAPTAEKEPLDAQTLIPLASNCYSDPHSPLQWATNNLKTGNSAASGLMRASGLRSHSHSAWSERCQKR